MEKMRELEVICLQCKKYAHKSEGWRKPTQEDLKKIEKAFEEMRVSHGICPECKEKALEEVKKFHESRKKR